MSARDEAVEIIRRICPPHLDADEYGRILAEKFDTHRAEVLAEAKTETVGWLVKKAVEHRAQGPQYAKQADVISRLASKVDRGAVRAFLGTGHYRDVMDEHEAEVLLKGAGLIEDAAEIADFTRSQDYRDGLRAGGELLTQHACGEKTTPSGTEVTPTDTNRRARLLHEMAGGGRWKSGDVVAWYEREGLTGLGVRAARHDLAVLRDSGAITQHDEKGVRFFTLNSITRKDVRS